MSKDQFQDAGIIQPKVNKAKDILAKVQAEKTQYEQDLADKRRADEFVNKVELARTKTHTRRIIDPKTKRFIGIKFRYVNDDYGKNIYDYLVYNEDSFERKIIENLNIEWDENDKKDGSWIDKPVNISWNNTSY